MFGLLLIAASNASADGGTKILFLGDSLTEGYGVSKEKSYPALVIEKLNHHYEQRRMGKRVEAIYGGISGSTSSSALSRLRWFLKAKPKVMLLAMGANDGLRGLPVPELEKNLDATVSLAKKEGIIVILAGMKLPPNYGEKNAAEFEAVYTRVAKKQGVTLIPFLLANVGGEKELNIDDGIHPNEKGHVIISELVFPYLEKVL
ncbi:MAG: arylesterase [Cryobacterium sp.]|nr:arylesterase [Oligoflexia bacterium]